MKRVSLLLVVTILLATAATPHPRRAYADPSSELLALIEEAYANLVGLGSLTAGTEQVYQAQATERRVTLDLTYQPPDATPAHLATTVRLDQYGGNHP
jgi:hypothetical protein